MDAHIRKQRHTNNESSKRARVWEGYMEMDVCVNSDSLELEKRIRHTNQNCAVFLKGFASPKGPGPSPNYDIFDMLHVWDLEMTFWMNS